MGQPKKVIKNNKKTLVTKQKTEPIKKGKTIDIEVDNLDNTPLHRELENTFSPSSTSMFCFKPKFYKPTNCALQISQSSMFTVKNLTSSTSDLQTHTNSK